jgi:hypothetical protein
MQNDIIFGEFDVEVFFFFFNLMKLIFIHQNNNNNNIVLCYILKPSIFLFFIF